MVAGRSADRELQNDFNSMRSSSHAYQVLSLPGVLQQLQVRAQAVHEADRFGHPHGVRAADVPPARRLRRLVRQDESGRDVAHVHHVPRLLLGVFSCICK